MPAVRDVAFVVFFGLLHFGLLQLGYLCYFMQENVSAFWPANGVALAVLLLARSRLWPAFISAALVAHIVTEVFLRHNPLLIAALFGFAGLRLDNGIANMPKITLDRLVKNLVVANRGL